MQRIASRPISKYQHGKCEQQLGISGPLECLTIVMWDVQAEDVAIDKILFAYANYALRIIADRALGDATHRFATGPEMPELTV